MNKNNNDHYAFIKKAQEIYGYRCLKVKYGDFVKMVAVTYYNWNGEKDNLTNFVATV